MKNIKFKVWDYTLGKIIYPYKDNKVIFSNDEWYVIDSDNKIINTYKKASLMQFTNCYDNTSWDELVKKNNNRITKYVYDFIYKLNYELSEETLKKFWSGIEIYENDIIIFNNEKFFVKYIDNNFYLFNSNKRFLLYKLKQKELKIIGNIIQTPDKWEQE